MRINNMDGSLESIPDAHVSAVHVCYRLLGFSLFLQFLGPQGSSALQANICMCSFLLPKHQVGVGATIGT